ncbi:MAG: alpha/beta hydrolase [Propionibacteriaceae bacterium]|nr:alpha/beta hydrolase [Propionibacteriaceae bacterium]
MNKTDTAERIQVGELEMHVEVRGTGSPLLLVAGAGGDAGQYTELADLLAPDRTVISYDRRSSSRTSRPDGWVSTTVEEQSDDAARLLLALDVGPTAVFGNSTGALIALGLALRNPERVTKAVLHEPALMAVLEDPDSAMASVQPVVAAGMEKGGMAGGAEAFLRFAAGAAYDRIPPDTLGRILSNADVLLQAEFGSFASWAPNPADLASSGVDITVLNGEQTAPFFREAAQWIADRRQEKVQTAPGGHMGFLEDPAGFAALLQALLRRK